MPDKLFVSVHASLTKNLMQGVDGLQGIGLSLSQQSLATALLAMSRDLKVWNCRLPYPRIETCDRVRPGSPPEDIVSLH
jgi:hypothetical protein